MSESVTQLDPGWSRRTWVIWMGGVLLFQVVFVMLLSSRRDPVPKVLQERAIGIQSWVGMPLESTVLESLGVMDPSLFAVAHRHGFSVGTARLPAPEVPVMEAILEPPYWLGHAQAQATNTVSVEERRMNSWVQGGTVERTAPDFSGLRSAVESLDKQTLVWFEGDLSGRSPRGVMNVPALLHSEVPQASVVQLGVDSAGIPQSVRLLSSSGVPGADQEALRNARGFRFKPVGLEAGETAKWMWGSAVFAWQSRGVNETNRVRH